MSDFARRRKYKTFLYFYQNGRCAYCLGEMTLTFEHTHTGGNTATLDHVKPVCHNGKTTWSNLVLCCSSCNHNKGHKKVTPVFPPLKQVGRVDIKGQGDEKIYQGLGSQTFNTSFIKQTVERIYGATETCTSYAGTTEQICAKQSQITIQPYLSPRYLKNPKDGLK